MTDFTGFFKEIFSVATIRSSWVIFGPKQKHSGIAAKFARLFD